MGSYGKIGLFLIASRPWFWHVEFVFEFDKLETIMNQG